MQPASSRYVRFLAPLGTLGVGLALFLLPGTRAWFSGALMLFTQRSVQTLQGAIRAADFPFVQSACLAAFQTCILPWLLPRQFIASSLCLGPFLGFLASFLGALAGCALWYGVARLLFLPCPRLPGRWNRPLSAAAFPLCRRPPPSPPGHGRPGLRPGRRPGASLWPGASRGRLGQRPPSRRLWGAMYRLFRPAAASLGNAPALCRRCADPFCRVPFGP